MKKTILSFMAFVAIAGLVFSSVAFGESSPADKVVVYYFHGAFRCATCAVMEKYSREAVEARFKDALASGFLEFKAVNVEEPDNEHFVKEYQLYTKALILSLVKGGREVKSKNLDKIWQLARDKNKFIDYVSGEIRQMLEDAR